MPQLKKTLLIFSILIFAFSLIYLSNKYALTDTVLIEGDQPDYQAISVNLIKGHGYKNGRHEDLNTYKFYNPTDYKEYLHDLNTETSYSFYRAPGYPFFMAAIYKLGGIHPRNVQIVQVILLSLSAALLPFFSHAFFKHHVLFTSLVSAALFILYCVPPPNLILTESLLIFSLICWTGIYIYWKKDANYSRTFLCGISTATILLIKEIFIFLPLCWIAYYVFLRFKEPKKRKRRIIFIYIISMLLGFAPWSIYTYSKTGDFILTTTHSKHALLDGNNEDTFKNGKWTPKWRKLPDIEKKYFYNKDHIKNLPYKEQYLRFLWHYRSDLPKLFVKKILRAYTYNKLNFWSLLLMTLYYLTLMITTIFRTKLPTFLQLHQQPPKYAEVPLLLFTNITLISVILFGDERFTLIFMYFFLLHATFYLVWLLHLPIEWNKHRLKNVICNNTE